MRKSTSNIIQIRHLYFKIAQAVSVFHCKYSCIDTDVYRFLNVVMSWNQLALASLTKVCNSAINRSNKASCPFTEHIT